MACNARCLVRSPHVCVARNGTGTPLSVASLPSCLPACQPTQPGKKGVALSTDEWAALCSAAPEIAQHLVAVAGGAAGSTAAVPAPAPAAAPQQAQQAAAPGGAGAAVAGGEGGPLPALPIELGSNRRADISNFKGQTFVGIREYYEKVRAAAGLQCASGQLLVCRALHRPGVGRASESALCASLLCTEHRGTCALCAVAQPAQPLLPAPSQCPSGGPDDAGQEGDQLVARPVRHADVGGMQHSTGCLWGWESWASAGS